ncbi:exported hypothetical protein [Bradyrhizobium sp. STM 3809]|nr:exported hypothetical protein [Bradyrhizobium sp. STM 3809]
MIPARSAGVMVTLSTLSIPAHAKFVNTSLVDSNVIASRFINQVRFSCTRPSRPRHGRACPGHPRRPAR